MISPRILKTKKKRCNHTSSADTGKAAQDEIKPSVAFERFYMFSVFSPIFAPLILCLVGKFGKLAPVLMSNNAICGIFVWVAFIVAIFLTGRAINTYREIKMYWKDDMQKSFHEHAMLARENETKLETASRIRKAVLYAAAPSFFNYGFVLFNMFYVIFKI